ncbi:outer membrane autotransporter protein [Variovorax paradoxus]|uniref:autotransporter outer membrane beta-barrel domain-containing protein n=1 Tax=Variovorax paradoxus TaxID=34073 RepID=UPI00278E514F|nr:autotransporter outer membrane beta-barrel domain-containing protein [Variovorax paradoxus]MDQ0573227.1 outer membrane autotransporter protein [Variovorax paradoxus]
MNRSFQSIWNEALGAWVAASEVSAARGKKSSGTVLAAGLLAAVAYGGASSAWAANECGAVAVGGTVICNGDGTPVGDANPNTTGIAYGTDGITVIVDGTAAPFTITPVTAPTTANGVYSGGGGTGNRRIEVNGPVTINVTTPAGNPVSGAAWAVLANSLASGAGGDASIVINGANITSKGENALGVATSVVGSGNATSILNSGSISTTGTQGSGVGLFAETHGIGTATVTVNGGSISTGTAAGGSHAAYALAWGNGDAVASMTGGKATTQAANNSVVVAQTLGSGIASATISGGTATTNGASSTVIAVGSGSGDAIASQTGGRVIANGAGGVGLAALAVGTGAATASMTGGSIATQGSNGYGIWSAVLNPASTAAATATMDAAASTVATGGFTAFGIYAENTGMGAASATLSNGSISTSGDAANGIYARTSNVNGTGATTLAMTGGTVETTGLASEGARAITNGLGAVTASMSGGSIRTSGESSNGFVGQITNKANTSDVKVTMTNGQIVTSGYSSGLGAVTSGLGNSTVTVTGGAITSTSGSGSTGVSSAITNFASTSTAALVMQGGSVTGDRAISVTNSGSGVAAATMSAGTATATGVNGDGLRVAARGGTYNVNVTGGSLTGGSGAGAAIHTTAAAGGTINIGAAATVNGAASGIAIRDGDFAQTGTDILGGNAVVTTAGTVTGDAILGLGNDSLALTGGRFSGNIYGDDRLASAADGNDSFTWTGGTLSGGFYGQNGSDTALVSAAGYNGSQVLDGGDDVSAADGWVDKLTLQGVTATAGGDTLRNWETITLDNTRLTLAGAPLVVGAGADAGGAPLGLFIQPTSSVFMGQPAFSVTGDVHNAGLIDLRNPAGTPGNLLSLYGNYAGANGIVRVNTALGSDASATDKLVVNGNTSGTSRVLVTNAGGAGAATINGIQVVQVTGTSSEGDFTLAAPVQAGAYEYGLHRGGRTDGDANSFYLSSVYNTPKPVPGVPSPAPVPVPAPEVLRPAVAGYVMGQVATQELGLGLLGSLHKRVGEQQTLKWDHCGCDDKAPADQLWMRLHAQRLDLDGKRQFGFEQEMQYVQLGKELAVRYSGDAADKSRSHTGLTAGYGRTSTHFSDRRRGDAGMGYDTGKMKGQMATLGAYHTRYADNGSYLDLVGQLHAVQNKYTDKYGGEGTQKGTGAGLSVEVGRPWQIGESQWLIEPQAQLSYQATRYRGFADNVSTVDGFTSQSLRGRVGARLAWNDKAERGDKLTRTNTFYVTADLLHEFKDPKAVTIGNTAVSEAWAKQTWAELGVGAQLPLSKAAYLYGGVQYQRSLSGTSREGVSGQLGVRVAW